MNERTRTFYKEVPVDDLAMAAKRLVTTVLACRCPACGEARVTRGVFAVARSCPACGSRFDRMEGNELIAIPLSFFATVLILLALSLWLIPRYGFFDGLMPLLLAVGVVSVVLLVRPTRVATLWFLWLLGFVHPDGLPGEGVHRVSRESSAPGTDRSTPGSDPK